jgi:hypothetical protein
MIMSMKNHIMFFFVSGITDHFGQSVCFNPASTAIGSVRSLFSEPVIKITTISFPRSLFLRTSNSLLNKTRSASILELQLRMELEF